MKKIKLFVITGLIALSGTVAQAQKFTEGDDNFTFLKGQKVLNLEYTYDNMLVGETPEEDYKKRKIAEYNEKQRGKGDRWAEKWVANRSAVYEPMFEELVNKVLSKDASLYVAKNKKDAKYTMIVHTSVTEPGFNSMVMKKNPYCNYEISWVETATGKVMAKAEMEKVAGVLMGGSAWDFDPANSIKECYAKAGKMAGKAMLKGLK